MDPLEEGGNITDIIPCEGKESSKAFDDDTTHTRTTAFGFHSEQQRPGWEVGLPVRRS